MNRITSDTYLDIGTPVQVNNKRGVVTSCSVAQAIPCGLVCLHTIKFDSERKRVSRSDAKYAWVPLKTNYSQRVNYSFIQTV